MAAKLDKWLTAQKKHKLSDKHIQMLRELGLNPGKLGKIDNHKQETWKAPLPQFIENIYFKRFKREEPLNVKPIKELMAEDKIKKEKQKKEKEKRRKTNIQEGSLLEIKSEDDSKTSSVLADSSKTPLPTNIEPLIKIKLESGDTYETILRKEAHLFDKAFDSIGKDEVSLAELGYQLKKLHPRYKPRRYGCKTLGAIYAKLDKYELVQVGENGTHCVMQKNRLRAINKCISKGLF